MAFYSVGVSLIPGTSDPRYFDVAVTGSPGSDAGARRTWHCRKRYNDFLRCKKSLKALGVRVAAFPPKITKFGLPVSGSNDLEKRRAKLVRRVVLASPDVSRAGGGWERGRTRAAGGPEAGA